jgi:hypothetical protein
MDKSIAFTVEIRLSIETITNQGVRSVERNVWLVDLTGYKKGSIISSLCCCDLNELQQSECSK